MIGQTLSHHRIIAPLGSGGMGVVYRATDTRLGRDVALKLLPESFAADPVRLARFEREARLLASLNHPNIAHMYSFEPATLADGSTAHVLVMELVEGEDLRERLKRGRLPPDVAIGIGKQIAAALEEAHEKGIVHRDLKPANVKLTPDGMVKILDFGLAKEWSGESASAASSADQSESPTLAHTSTAAGIIVGTAAYMSPEQARGKAVDRRTDVWAFGVVLFEMLSGRRLFDGETVTDILAAVVREEIPWDALPGETPASVRRLLGRCLDRDSRQRLRDIGEARIALDAAAAAAGADAGPAELARPARRGRARERWAWAALAVTLAGLAASLGFERFGSSPAARPAHFLLDTPSGLGFPDLEPPALSPDGRYVVFTGRSEDRATQLFIRPLDSPETRALPGTEGASSPFWSADSTSVAFTTAGELRKLLLAGGAVQRVCLLPRDRFVGGTWSQAGTIVFSTGGPSATLYQVSAAGGDATPLTTLDKSRGEAGHWWPQFLPGGQSLLFQVGSGQEASAGLHAISLDSPGARRRVLPDRARFQYVAGRLLAVRGGVLAAQPFDGRRLAASGQPVPIASGVATWANDSSWGWFSASASDRLAWVSASDSTVRLEWIDRQGRRLGSVGEPGRYSQIALSPDDKKVAVEIPGPDGRFDIWSIDVVRGLASRLTSDAANERDPVWSPDSQELVFSSDAGGNQDLLRKRLQEPGPAVALPRGSGATPGADDVAESWSRDGRALVYVTLGEERAVWAISLDADAAAEPLLKGRFAIDEPHVSPDGRWLAYVSSESGRFEIYVEQFRRRGERVRVSSDGGGQPRWRDDGNELFFLSQGGGLMAVSVREGATGPEVGVPATLVAADQLRAIVQGPDYDDYAVSADGQRFLVKRPAGSGERQRIHVLLDWAPLRE